SLVSGCTSKVIRQEEGGSIAGTGKVIREKEMLVPLME
ncbi:unnamed protein product, partial [marine sediment metagenome]